MPAYKLTPDLTTRPGDLIVGDVNERGTDKVYMGTVAESGPHRQLYLDVTSEQVVAILGKRGTGKSYSLGVLLEGLAAGTGRNAIAAAETPRAGLVLDILDIFWTSSIPLRPSKSPELQRQYARMHAARLDTVPLQVDLWIPAGYERPSIDPPMLNTLRISPNVLESDDWAALFDVDLATEPRGMLLLELIQKVADVGWSDGANNYAPNPGYGFQELLRCLDTDPDLLQAYRDDTRRSVRQRLSAYAAQPLFSGTGVPLIDLFQPGRISILMMARLPDSLKRVLATLLVKRLMRERRDASFAKKRLDLAPYLTEEDMQRLKKVVQTAVPRSWILIDEAQVLAPADESTVSRDTLVKYAKEGRNYGLSLAITTQQPSAVDQKLMSQVETLLVHQLTARQDIDVAVRNIKSALPASVQVDGNSLSIEDLIRKLQQGEVLFSCANAGRLNRACILDIRPRVSAHGGYEA